MHSVEELAKSPELNAPRFKSIDYKVQTYRGMIPVSNESLQDSTPDLANLVAQNNARIALNTDNKLIADVMKTFTKVDIKDTDDIKTVINTKIDPAYSLTLVASASFFNILDQLKDKSGQYILQQDITSPSQRSLFGIKVEVISDKLLGEQGEANAFLGDISQAIMYADRAQASVRWVQNDIYGDILGISQRADVIKANDEAGFFLTFNADSPSTEA
jgi:HK97 family phage major capsid protein